MQPIFSRNDDIDKMAFMNWRMQDESPIRHFMNMADGYLALITNPGQAMFDMQQ